MKCEIDIAGRVLQIDAVERFLCKEEDFNSVSVDRHGFLFPLFEDEGRVISISNVLTLKGGVIVGEGDAGKSVYQAMLRDQAQHIGVESLILLREYRNNIQRLNDIVERAVKESKNKACDCFVFIDGIDENPDSVYTIGSIWRSYAVDDKIHIWISSRQREEINLLLKECSTIRRYRLLPIRYCDAQFLLNQVGIEKDIISDCLQKGLVQFLVRPSTCLTVADLYIRNTDIVDDVKSMFEQMVISLSEQRRDGRIVLSGLSQTRHVISQTIKCAAWITAGLSLGQKHGIWMGAQSQLPDDCLYFEDFVAEPFSIGLVVETLNSRLFEPLANYYIRLSYACLEDYLTARWLNDTVSTDNIRSLLSVEQGKCPTSNLHKVEWLNTLTPAIFSNELLDGCPELFLWSSECVNAIGIDTLVEKLFDRYCSMAPYDRIRVIKPKLLALKCNELIPIIRSMLLSEPVVPNKVMFAIDVIAATDLIEVQDLILEFALDIHRPTELRKNVVELMWQLGDKFSPENAPKLLALLSEDAIRTDVEFRGYLLSVLWPRFVRVEVLLPELVPTNGAYSGRYAEFVAYQFANGLPKELSKNEMLALLGWAAQNIYHRSSVDALSKAAALVFSVCWKGITDDDVLAAALKCYYEYCRQSHDFNLPFASDDEFKYAKVAPLDRLEFESNQDMRFRVLERIIEDEVIETFYLPLLDAYRSVRYPLYSAKDFNRLYDRIIKGSSHIERWTRCLSVEVCACKLDDIRDKLVTLHQRFPAITEFSIEYVQTEQQKDLERKSRQEFKQQEESKSKIASFNEMIEHFSKELSRKTGKELGGVFLRLCYWFPSDSGEQAIPVLDITSTPGWKALNEDLQAKCVLAAKELLVNCVRKPQHHKIDGYEEACALRLIIDKDPDWIKNGGIDKTLIAVLTLILSHSQYISNDIKIAATIDGFAMNNEEASRIAVLKVVKAEHAEHASMVLDYWGNRLSPVLVDDILQYLSNAEFDDVDLPRIFHSLHEHGYRDKVSTFILDVLQIDKTELMDGMHDHLSIFVLAHYPEIIWARIATFIQDTPEKVDAWIMRVLNNGAKSALVSAIKRAPVEAFVCFCVFLEQTHPAESRVPIPSGVFDSTADHELTFFINDIKWMLSRGDREDAIEVAERVNSTLGGDRWKPVVDGARYALNYCRIVSPPIAIKELARYFDLDIGDRLRVYSSSDLLQVILKMLSKYDSEYLHSETSAVTDLWNEIPEHLNLGYVLIPKYEKELSNHIARYLKLAAPEFAIDREVLVTPRPYKYSDQDSGYVDLKIQSQDLSRHIQPGVVHIEVKCNWNREVATNLETQLYQKYVQQTPNSCGIFLCGCFASPRWFEKDYRYKQIVKGYKTVDEAKASLKEQLLRLPQSDASKIAVVAIDCSIG